MKLGFNIPVYPSDLTKNVKQETKPEIKSNSSDFTKVLKETFQETNALQMDADQKTTDLLSGRTDNIHEVMIASQKAEVSLSFMIEVRNRLLEAYQEFSRMQV